MSDIALCQLILNELEFEPGVDAAHIGVVVEDGVVTLTGYVHSDAERAIAEQAVARIKGVKAIERAAWPAPGVSVVDDRIRVK